MKTKILMILILLIFSCIIFSENAFAWYSTYTYMQYHTINSVDGTLSYYPVAYNVYNTIGTSLNDTIFLNNNSVNFPYDIKFCDINNNVYPYWIESSNSTYAYIWVNITSITSNSTQKIYVYYGKINGANENNGSLTFSLFDDFSGSTLNNTWASTGCTVANDNVTISSPNKYMNSLSQFNVNNSTRFKMIQNGYPITGFMNYVAGVGCGANAAIIYNGADQGTQYQATNYKTSVATVGSYVNCENTWTIYEIKRISTTSVSYIKNNIINLGSLTTNVPITDLNTSFATNYKANYNHTVAWVLVRKISINEPVKSEYSGVLIYVPIAEFYGIPITGLMPLNVSFYDNSTGSIGTYFNWSFGDNSVNNTNKNCSHIFSNIGYYNIMFTVSNINGTSSIIKNNYIYVNYPLPIANFTYNNTNGTAPLMIQFNDTSYYPTAWLWDFDNNGLIDSIEQNPKIFYGFPGAYTIKLTVTNPSGSNTTIKTWAIIVSSAINGTNATISPTIKPTGYSSSGNELVYIPSLNLGFLLLFLFLYGLMIFSTHFISIILFISINIITLIDCTQNSHGDLDTIILFGFLLTTLYFVEKLGDK